MLETSLYDNQVSDIVDAQNGNETAMEKLININNGLIWSIVKRFKDRGFETEDLYQIAVIGFIKSIKKFDTSFDVKLSTYAVPYILGELKRYMQTDGPIKISRTIKELLYKISPNSLIWRFPIPLKYPGNLLLSRYVILDPEPISGMIEVNFGII